MNVSPYGVAAWLATKSYSPIKHNGNRGGLTLRFKELVSSPEVIDIPKHGLVTQFRFDFI